MAGWSLGENLFVQSLPRLLASKLFLVIFELWALSTGTHIEILIKMKDTTVIIKRRNDFSHSICKSCHGDTIVLLFLINNVFA